MKANGHSRSDPRTEQINEEMLKCASSLKAFAISLCRNEVRAEDLVQETLLRALANIHSFQAGTNVTAWLFTILRNYYRSEYRKHRREVEDVDGHYAESLTVQADQEDSLGFEQMLEYLACLPVEQSDALVAVGYLGMSYEEAAERLDCAVGTVKSRVNRARTLLIELMEGAVVNKFDLLRLKNATKGVPRNHPYYPIAEAYEELYADSLGVVPKEKPAKSSKNKKISNYEQAWQDIVASGALDQPLDDIPSFIRE